MRLGHADGALYWKAYAENKMGQRADALSTLVETLQVRVVGRGQAADPAGDVHRRKRRHAWRTGAHRKKLGAASRGHS